MDARRMCVAFLGIGVALAFQGNVMPLDGSFNERKGEFPWLVEFYAPWCGHCKKLQPIFEKVALELAGTDIHVAKLDATLYSTVAAAFDIRGYPTVKFIKGGRILTYSGDRSVEGLKKFALRANGPSVASIENVNAYHTLVDRQEPFFVYSGAKEDQLYAFYLSVAEKFIVQADFYETSSAILSSATHLDATPAVRVFKEGQHYEFNANGVEEPAAVAISLERWVNVERFGIVQYASPVGFHDLTTLERLLVVLVTNTRDVPADVASKLTSMFARVARQWKAMPSSSSYQFVRMDDPETVGNILMGTPQLPFLFVFNPADSTYILPDGVDQLVHQHLFNDDGDLTVFLQNVLEGNVTVRGGNGLLQRFRRVFYEIASMTISIWMESRILFIVVVCLPIFVLCVIFYTVCCMAWGGDDGDEDEIATASASASELAENVGHAKTE